MKPQLCKAIPVFAASTLFLFFDPCTPFQIYGYRMSLWAEHLGLGKEEKHFEDPQTLECVKRVNEIADDNWKRYTDESFMLLRGHLLKYPVHVDADGNVCPLPGCETFPDVGGRITGAYSTAVPDILTT